MRQEVIKSIIDHGIVAVIRAESAATAAKIAKACLAGGIKVIEVTFTVPGAHQVISALDKEFRDSGLLLGAGTILDPAAAKTAITAGARFIVSPAFDEKTASVCDKSDIPYLPGCLTVTEMMRALAAGTEVIKLFPGSAFGPGYVKAIKGPLPDIKLMPTGGVSLDNIQDWFACGVVAVGVGGELTAPAKTNDFQGVTDRARAFVQAVNSARKSAQAQ